MADSLEKSPSPPVTALEFQDALRHLVALEKKLRVEMQSNLRELKLHMTQRRIDRVANKAQRLFQIRQQLSCSKHLFRQEEEIMHEFEKIKRLLSTADLDEDEWDRTKMGCQVLGGRLAQIRRRQRRLSGQVEDLEATIEDLLATPLTDEDVEGLDLNDLRLEQEAELGAAIPSLSSYSLFNSAPYGNLGQDRSHPLQKSFSEVKTSSAFQRPGSRTELALPSSHLRPASAMGRGGGLGGGASDADIPGYGGGFKTRDTTTDGSQDDLEDSAYYPSRRKKRLAGLERHGRKPSFSSDTDDDSSLYQIMDSEKLSAKETQRLIMEKEAALEFDWDDPDEALFAAQDDTWRAQKEADLKNEQVKREKLLKELEEKRLREEEKEMIRAAEEKRRLAAEQERQMAEERKKRKRLKEEEIEAKRKAGEEGLARKMEAELEELKEKQRLEELEAERKQEESRLQVEQNKKQMALQQKEAEEEQKKVELEKKKKQRAEAIQKKKEEMEAKRKAEEEQKALEMEEKKKAEEKVKKQKAEALQKKKEEAEAKRKAEEDQQALEIDEKKKAEEEKKKQKAEALKKKRDEAEAKRKAEEEQKALEMEEKKKVEEEKKKQKAEALKKKRDEAEAKRKAEEEQKAFEMEEKKKAEEEKKKQKSEAVKKKREEAETKKKAEEEKKKLELEEKKRVEEEKKMAEEEKKKQKSEALKKKEEEAEAKKKAEEEQKKLEMEERKRAEEEKKMAEEEKQRQKAETLKKKKEEVEAKKKAEEEKKKLEIEEKKRIEVEKKKAEEEKRNLKSGSLKKKKEADAKKKAEEESEKKKAEEEQKKATEDKKKEKTGSITKKKDAEAKKKADADNKKQAEKEHKNLEQEGKTMGRANTLKKKEPESKESVAEENPQEAKKKVAGEEEKKQGDGKTKGRDQASLEPKTDAEKVEEKKIAARKSEAERKKAVQDATKKAEAEKQLQLEEEENKKAQKKAQAEAKKKEILETQKKVQEEKRKAADDAKKAAEAEARKKSEELATRKAEAEVKKQRIVAEQKKLQAEKTKADERRKSLVESEEVLNDQPPEKPAKKSKAAKKASNGPQDSGAPQSMSTNEETRMGGGRYAGMDSVDEPEFVQVEPAVLGPHKKPKSQKGELSVSENAAAEKGRYAGMEPVDEPEFVQVEATILGPEKMHRGQKGELSLSEHAAVEKGRYAGMKPVDEPEFVQAEATLLGPQKKSRAAKKQQISMNEEGQIKPPGLKIQESGEAVEAVNTKATSVGPAKRGSKKVGSEKQQLSLTDGQAIQGKGFNLGEVDGSDAVTPEGAVVPQKRDRSKARDQTGKQQIIPKEGQLNINEGNAMQRETFIIDNSEDSDALELVVPQKRDRSKGRSKQQVSESKAETGKDKGFKMENAEQPEQLFSESTSLKSSRTKQGLSVKDAQVMQAQGYEEEALGGPEETASLEVVAKRRNRSKNRAGQALAINDGVQNSKGFVQEVGDNPEMLNVEKIPQKGRDQSRGRKGQKQKQELVVNRNDSSSSQRQQVEIIPGSGGGREHVEEVSLSHGRSGSRGMASRGDISANDPEAVAQPCLFSIEDTDVAAVDVSGPKKTPRAVKVHANEAPSVGKGRYSGMEPVDEPEFVDVEATLLGPANWRPPKGTVSINEAASKAAVAIESVANANDQPVTPSKRGAKVKIATPDGGLKSNAFEVQVPANGHLSPEKPTRTASLDRRGAKTEVKPSAAVATMEKPSRKKRGAERRHTTGITKEALQSPGFGPMKQTLNFNDLQQGVNAAQQPETVDANVLAAISNTSVSAGRSTLQQLKSQTAAASGGAKAKRTEAAPKRGQEQIYSTVDKSRGRKPVPLTSAVNIDRVTGMSLDMGSAEEEEEDDGYMQPVPSNRRKSAESKGTGQMDEQTSKKFYETFHGSIDDGYRLDNLRSEADFDLHAFDEDGTATAKGASSRAAGDEDSLAYNTLDSGISVRSGMADEAAFARRGSSHSEHTPEVEEARGEIYAEEFELAEAEGRGRRRMKKVSFSEKDQKFKLRPDPDVKTLPGTNLYCFAPSSTHKQPSPTPPPEAPYEPYKPPIPPPTSGPSLSPAPAPSPISISSLPASAPSSSQTGPSLMLQAVTQQQQKDQEKLQSFAKQLHREQEQQRRLSLNLNQPQGQPHPQSYPPKRQEGANKMTMIHADADPRRGASLDRAKNVAYVNGEPVSTSPKAFLKAMLPGQKKSRSRDSSLSKGGSERGGSGGGLFGSLMRKGGSRASSVDRHHLPQQQQQQPMGAATSRLYQTETDSLDGMVGGTGTQNNIGTSSVDSMDLFKSAKSSQEPYVSDTESSEFVGSMKKKKKSAPKRVATTDFDELFARGHARSAQMETGRGLGAAQQNFGFQPGVAATSAAGNLTLDLTAAQNYNADRQMDGYPENKQATPFELYSREAAFKQSQKEAGIGYEEKVQSFLHDQQARSYGGPGDPTTTQAQDTAGIGFDVGVGLGQSMVHGRTGHFHDPRQQQYLQQDFVPHEQYRSASGTRQSRQDRQQLELPFGPSSSGQSANLLSGGTSPVPKPRIKIRSRDSSIHSRRGRTSREMTPLDFLKTLENLVKEAEVDVGNSQFHQSQQQQQHVWPATAIDSTNDYFNVQQSARTNYDRDPLQPFGSETNQPLNQYKLQPQPQQQNLLNPGYQSQKQRSTSGSPYQQKQQDYSRGDPSPTRSGGVSPQRPNMGTAQTSPAAAPTASSVLSNLMAPQQFGGADGRSSPFQPQHRANYSQPLTSMSSQQSASQSTSLLGQPYTSQNDRSNQSFNQNQPTSSVGVGGGLGLAGMLASGQQPNFSSSALSEDTRFQSQMQQLAQPPRPGSRRGSIALSQQQQQQQPPMSNVPMSVAADAHMPQTLHRDPLTSDDLGYAEEDNAEETMQDLELYRRLQDGLAKHGVAGGLLAVPGQQQAGGQPLEKSASSDNFGKYSHHLGRAEFGTLKKRTSVSQGGSRLASRDPSNERPATAAGSLSAGLAAPSTLMSRSKKPSFSSQASQESASSRLSDSNIPDLESTSGAGGVMGGSLGGTGGSRTTYRPTSGPLTLGSTTAATATATGTLTSLNIASGNASAAYAGTDALATPSSFLARSMMDKKKDVLDQMAQQKKAAKEAKAWLLLLLLSALCICVMVYLQEEGQ